MGSCVDEKKEELFLQCFLILVHDLWILKGYKVVFYGS